MSEFEACDCTIWSFCCEELPKAVAEIERLRAALEKIARHNFSEPEMVDVARQALNPDKE